MIVEQPPVTLRMKKSFPTKNVATQFRDPGVLYIDRYYTHKDGPFDVDKARAETMLKAGIVEVVARVPGPAERATGPAGEKR